MGVDIDKSLVDIAEPHRIIVLLIWVVNQSMGYVIMLQIPLHQEAQQVPTEIIVADQVSVLVHQTNVVRLLDTVVLPKVFPPRSSHTYTHLLITLQNTVRHPTVKSTTDLPATPTPYPPAQTHLPSHAQP